MPDAIVVGAGHNGLIAACYLAAAGLQVEVLERDQVLGGCVSTVERFPGYRVDRGSSAHIMIRRTGICEELELAQYGLDYIVCDPWAFAPLPGAPGGGISFFTDLERTVESITAVCGAADGRAYRRFVTCWGPRNAAVFDAFGRRPTPGALAWTLGRVGRHESLSRMELTRQFLAPGDALLDSYFSDERLKAALAWLGCQSGPPMHEAATADLVGWVALLHDTPPAHPRGGSGALTDALVARLRATGGTVRPGTGAARITGSPAGVTGVLTTAGEHVRAPVVVTACHVLTAIDLAAGLLPPTLVARAHRTIRVGTGMGMAVRLGAAALPRYPGAGPGATAGLQLLVDDRAVLRRAYADFLAGAPPAAPAVLAMSFSGTDDSLAPPGRHSLTLWAQWHPYMLADRRSWAEVADSAAAACIAAVERRAPGFTAGVEHVHVQSPADLQEELGLLGGNVMHVEMTLDAMFALRPLPELSSYRGGVDGLYLTGASMHPGGGVHGASGRAVARLVLRDRARRARRRFPGTGIARPVRRDD